MTRNYIDPIVSIDLHVRPVEEGYIASIRAVASVILDPHYAVTGGALDWAAGASSDIQACQWCDHFLESLDSTLTEGIDYLYQATGLYAEVDGYAGMFFIAPYSFFQQREG